MAPLRARRLRRGALLELDDLALEVAEVVETLVDGRESHGGDRVELAQPLEHRAADPLARDLVTTRSGGVFDLVREGVDGSRVDRAPGDRSFDPGADLLEVERLSRARPFDDHQRELVDALVGGEPGAAARALPPAPPRRAFV